MKIIEFETYKTYYVGKLLSCSKIAHLWIIYLDNKKIPIEVKESKLSKKISISIDQKNLIKTKSDNFKDKNGYTFFKHNLKFTIIKKKWNKMNLYINNFIFVPGKKIKINTEKKKVSKEYNFEEFENSSHSSLESEKTLANEKIGINKKKNSFDYSFGKDSFNPNSFDFQEENGYKQFN